MISLFLSDSVAKPKYTTCIHVHYISGRDAISAESLVRQLGVVIKDVPKLFTINVEDREEPYFSSLIASSKYNSSSDINVKILCTITSPYYCISSSTIII